MQFSQKSHKQLTFIMKFVKFLTVHNKRAFRNDGLFHIIYAEEPTYFIVNFEDS